MWYVVDVVDRVAELSPDWLAAAQRGGAPGLLPDAVIGRPIWSFIEGETVCFHYAQLFESVRQSGRTAQLRLRDDGPGRQSLLQMTVTPWPRQALRVAFHPVRERAVPISPLWNWRLARSAEVVLACSFCKFVQIDGAWMPIAEAELRRPDLRSSCPPEAMHHVCPACEGILRREGHLACAERSLTP